MKNINPLIRNCKFKFKCENKWGDLEVIEDYSDRRHCKDCQKDVHLVENIFDLRKALEFDVCIAVPLRETDAMWADDAGNNGHLLGILDKPRIR